jgi:GAF domain-containing protein
MQRKKHNSAVDEKAKLQEVLNIGLEITQTKDIDILLERILTKARHFTNADAGSIYIKEDNTLRFRYTQNETEQKKLPPGKKLIYSTFAIPVSNQSISGYVANTGETLNIDDVYHLDNGVSYSFDPSYDNITGYCTKSVLAFPLKAHDGGVVGVLQLINAKNKENNIVPFERSDEPYIMHSCCYRVGTHDKGHHSQNGQNGGAERPYGDKLPCQPRGIICRGDL